MTITIRPECYEHLPEHEWEALCLQMVGDLIRIAADEGCIASAWALKLIEEYENRLDDERITIVPIEIE